MSTLALAVVCAVLVETGLNRSRLGKLLMSATFVTDLSTATALSLVFIRPNGWFLLFLGVSVALIVALPRVAPAFFCRYGDRVIEPEIDRTQFSLLLSVVVGSAVIPTFIAQRWFTPRHALAEVDPRADERALEPEGGPLPSEARA